MAIADEMTAHKIMIGYWDMKCKRRAARIPNKSKNGCFNSFCWIWGWTLYQTLIEKWIFRLNWGDFKVSMINGSWDIDYPKIQPFLAKSAILG